MQYFDPERFVNRFKERTGRLITPKRFVGLALEDNAILAADVRREKGRFIVSSTKSFPFPEGADLKDPEKLGRALGEFLRENRFSARKAIIGIPAKWLMIREKIIPGVSKGSIIGVLKIHAEREFSLSPEELALDYTGLAAEDKSNRIFLLAMLRGNMDKAILAVRWAGLDVLSVTVSSIVLFSMIRANMFAPVPRYFLYIRKDYAEFLARDGEQTVDVKHIQRDLKAEPGAFVTELRRIMANYSNAAFKDGSEQLLIWNASGDPAREELKAMAEALPSYVKCVEGNRQSFAGKLDLPAGQDADIFIAPAMLARTFNSADPFFIDFLHSHLNVKQGHIKKNQVVWAFSVAAGVAVIFLALFFLWRAENKEIAQLKAALNGKGADVSATKDIIQKLKLSGGWYTERPRILDCLNALTAAFPEEGSIWVTSLALTQEMAGVITGRATNESSIISILDQLKGNPLFSDVQMIYLQNSGGASQEVSFSMNFSYQEKEEN
jgi:hypothetical protein